MYNFPCGGTAKYSAYNYQEFLLKAVATRYTVEGSPYLFHCILQLLINVIIKSLNSNVFLFCFGNMFPKHIIVLPLLIPRPALRTKNFTRKQISVPYECFGFPPNNLEISGEFVVYDIHVIQT